MTGLFEEQLPSSGVYPFGALGKALRIAVLATSLSDEALPGWKLEAKTTVSGNFRGQRANAVSYLDTKESLRAKRMTSMPETAWLSLHTMQG